MSDPTETARRFLIDNDVPATEAAKADVKYDTKQLQEHFTVHGFLAPFVTVTRKPHRPGPLRRLADGRASGPREERSAHPRRGRSRRCRCHRCLQGPLATKLKP